MKVSGSPVEVRAAGTTIWDHEGKAYLDFAGGYGVFTLGHSHPRVVAAVKAQLDLMSLSGKTMFDPLAGRLARAGRVRPATCRCRSSPTAAPRRSRARSSSTRAATGRAKIVATHGAFHGKTIGSLSVTGRDYFPRRVRAAARRRRVRSLRRRRRARRRAGRRRGVHRRAGAGRRRHQPAAAGLSPAARALCDAAGALLIVDEVQTGLGRCGKLFACEFDGVVPDVMTLAKGLSGGVVPIGAYIARPAAWNAAYAKAPLMHTSTFGGSPLACAAALAALDVLRDDGLVRNAAERGAQLLAGARRVAAAFPAVVADVRGVGLLVGVELRSEGYGGTIIPEMLKRGVTAAWTLNLQRVIRLEPPLIVTEAEVDCAIGALEEAVGAAYERLGALGEATA